MKLGFEYRNIITS